MQQTKQSERDAAAIQRIFNTATVAVGGLYLATHSVTVTAIGTIASAAVTCWSTWMANYRLDTRSTRSTGKSNAVSAEPVTDDVSSHQAPSRRTGSGHR